LLLVPLLLCLPQAGYGFPIFGNGTLGSFTGDLSYDSGTLTLSLTNTSDPSNGGYITGFALNNPQGLIESVSLLQDPGSPWQLLGATSFDNSVKAQPFGYFDFGAALGGDWLGGGAPGEGIAAGSSQTFTFALTLAGAGVLTDDEFLKELSMKKQGQNFIPFEGGEFLAVRFKGFIDDGSDKVAGSPVPEPMSLLLLGSGLLGLVGFRKRMKQK
jgi:hypothetical protein